MQGGNSNFIKLHKTDNENEDTDEQNYQNERHGIETPKLELSSQTKTPQLEDNHPLTKTNHSKNVVSDDFKQQNFTLTEAAAS